MTASSSCTGDQRQIYLSDVLTHVLDDHLVCGDGLHGEQTPLVDAAATEAQFLLAELQVGGKKIYFDQKHKCLINTASLRERTALRFPSVKLIIYLKTAELTLETPSIKVKE